ncbi:MlaD family protein [Serratia sp. DD3]|uniref:MlaD family protein n=1 Tax=Serratia sp. DD3 TaxID=1410619 RepID=UPI0003C51B11|nr:MlaD family protein [Serratia sp. DD3]KEY60336.1 virulence factor Mce family protein [Serratia sp. DD3]
METRAHHVLIGLFTLIIFSAVLFFSVWLTKSGSDREFTLYDIVFNESVNGLSQGSVVNYSGIRVGEVVQLRLDREVPTKVWARIRVTASTPIRQDTRARLAMAGITGTANIQLSGGSESSPMLTAQGSDIPVIIATPSPLNQLLSSSEDLMTNINEVLIRLNQILTPDNQRRLTNTLENLDKITDTVAGQRDDIRTILQQLALVTKQSNDALAQASRLMGNANTLLDGQGKQLVSNAANTMASLEKTTAILNKLVSENQQALSSGVRGFNDLGPAMDELRRTLATLRASLNRLEENPSALLRGRERTKEFTPK